jgi:threonine synthase
MTGGRLAVVGAVSRSMEDVGTMSSIVDRRRRRARARSFVSHPNPPTFSLSHFRTDSTPLLSLSRARKRKNNNKQLLNNTVLLKREDTQPVFSFKIRGAYNKMASLPPHSLDRGVVACSAGNHAQGVALSARMLGCRAVICMPLATPVIKVSAVRAHGGGEGGRVEVRLIGDNYDEAAAEARRLEREEGLAMIHPFDDELVIAGQGTIGEFFRHASVLPRAPPPSSASLEDAIGEDECFD